MQILNIFNNYRSSKSLLKQPEHVQCFKQEKLADAVIAHACPLVLANIEFDHHIFVPH